MLIAMLLITLAGFVIGLSGMFIFEKRNWKWWTWVIVLNILWIPIILNFCK